MGNLLALDQATRTTGYAVFKNQQLYKVGTFTFADNEIAFEDIQLQENRETKVANVDTFQKLAEVFGVLEELCTEIDMPYQIISASSWKSLCGIKGRDRAAQKKNAQLYIQDKYNIKVAQDACDAICIGEYGVKHSKQMLIWE